MVIEMNKVRELAKSNPTAEGVLLSLAVRKRNTRSTDLRRHKITLVKEGLHVVDSDYMTFWKQLEAIGAGSIIYGRRGKPNRFKWNYSLIDIGNLSTNPSTLKGVHVKPEVKKSSGFNRSEFMKAFWAKRKKHAKTPKGPNRDKKLISLLYKLAKELEKRD